MQDEKIDHLEKILNVEREIKALLKKKADADFLEIIENENEIINKIDLLDFNKASLIRQITQISGIDPEMNESCNTVKSEPLFNEFILKRKNEKQILIDINEIKNINIKEMELVLDETLKDADEIERIERIKTMLTKYPQSS